MQKFVYYTSLQRKILEGFLKCRGLSFKRAITKSVIISLLKEDNKKNPIVA